MLSFDRSWLSRSILIALGGGSLLGFGGCGGAATGELGDDFDGFAGGGDAGRTGSTGGSGGTSGSLGGSGGRGGTGSAGTGAGAGGSSGGFGGAAGSAGSFSGGSGGGGFSGSAGSAGTAGSAGSAGSTSMPGPSVCVDLSSGLAGLPSQAFPAEDAMVREFCGGAIADDNFVFQAVCLPAPGNGQSCTSAYRDDLITLFYSCGGQRQANFLCGPQEPLPGTDGCRGNECCYVLVGDCGR